MAGTPRLKIFSPEGEYVAACRYAEDAAALCAVHGKGAEVRLGHAKKDRIWHEGHEAVASEDSYDAAAEIIISRWEDSKAAARRHLDELRA